MPVEKSAGEVVFYRSRTGKIEYLLLQHRGKQWAFPKGLIEAGESDKEAAKREVTEESGIKDPVLLPDFKEYEKYSFKVKYKYQLRKGWRMNEGVFKIVTFFLAQAKTKKVKLSFEHEDFLWLDYEKAIEKLTHPAAKKILMRANVFLTKND